MLKWILIPVILICSLDSYCQGSAALKSHQDTVTRLTGLITADKLLSSPAVSVGGTPSKPFYRFIYLLSIIKTDELVTMVNDTSRYLRVYGYLGLLHRKHPNLNKIRQRLLKDTALIETISGCNAEMMTVAKAISSINSWYYKKGFDMLLKEEVSADYVRGYPIKTLLIE